MTYPLFVKKLFATIVKFFSLEGNLFRYSLSFSFLFALLPSILIIVVLIQYSVIPVSSITNFLYQYLPEGLIQPFINYIVADNSSAILSTSITLLISAYLASRSFYSFMLISAKDENFGISNILIRIKAFFLFIFFIVAVIVAFSLMIAFKFSLSIFFVVALFIIFYVFFRMLSFKKRPFTFGLLGSLFTSITIMGIGYYFFFFITNFTNYSNIYGPLSSIVILIISIYLVSNVIYFGYCLNISFAHELDHIEYKSIHYYTYGQKLIDRIKLMFVVIVK